MEDEQQKKRGRPSTGATVKCSVMLEPDMYEWAKDQVGGLAETVRNALRAWQRMAHVKPIAETGHEDESISSSFDRLPDKHQRSLMKLISILSLLGEKEACRLETYVYFGSDGNNVLNIQDEDNIHVTSGPTKTAD